MSVASPDDWLYGHVTGECHANLSYTGTVQPPDVAARVTMSVIWGLGVIAITLMPRDTSPAPSAVVARPNSRWDMLDAVRITAIMAVVTEHCGGTQYSYHNTMLVTMVVLPWLFITSGIAFMMSRSSALGYFGRLGLLFVVGFLFNMFGDIIARPGWYDDIGNTVFQMSYVVGLALFAVVSWPLRAVLRPGSDESARQTTNYVALGLYGAAWLFFAIVYVANITLVPTEAFHSSWGSHVAPIFANLPWICSHVTGFLALTSLHATLGRTTDGRLTWMLFAYVYVPRVLFPMRFALAPMMMFFFLLGLVVQSQPLSGSSGFVSFVQPYWLFVATLLILTSMADLTGRCDLYPPTTLWERFRWDAIEFVLAIMLVTKTLSASDPLKIISPLSWWALFAFCSHVCFARVFSQPSSAAILEFALMPVFVLGFRIFDMMKPKKEEEEPPKKAEVALPQEKEQSARSPLLFFLPAEKKSPVPSYGTV